MKERILGFAEKKGIAKANADFLLGIVKAFDKSTSSEEPYKAMLEMVKILEEGGLLAKGEFALHSKELRSSKS